jgi:hypothetical protein
LRVLNSSEVYIAKFWVATLILVISTYSELTLWSDGEGDRHNCPYNDSDNDEDDDDDDEVVVIVVVV